MTYPIPRPRRGKNDRSQDHDLNGEQSPVSRPACGELTTRISVSGKTALLVAADPWSQSGKAKAARHLGVRIVTEQVFLYYLEQILAERPRR